jgi:hypothetical protein
MITNEQLGRFNVAAPLGSILFIITYRYISIITVMFFRQKPFSVDEDSISEVQNALSSQLCDKNERISTPI